MTIAEKMKRDAMELNKILIKADKLRVFDKMRKAKTN